jgi:hypothetical protein
MMILVWDLEVSPLLGICGEGTPDIRVSRAHQIFASLETVHETFASLMRAH